MKRLFIALALLGAVAALPGQAEAGWRHRCRDCGPYTAGYTPYYSGGYYSSAYRWGGYYPYTTNYGPVGAYGWGAPGFGATWGFGVGGF